jgi:Fic family protein
MKLARAFTQAMRLLQELPTPEQADDLDRLTSFLFLRREAIQSSRMEGTWSTIDHVLTPGEIYDSGEGKTERASVLGYAHALEENFQAAFKKGTAIFSKALVCGLHKKVLKDDPHYRGIPGKLRESVVFIGGLRRKEESVYNPTPPRHVERCLEEVLHWMRDQELIELGDAGMGIPLPVRLAIGHSHFEAVHPFPDGNGRVGRMLMTLQMASYGVLPIYLSGFIEAEKSSYVQALQESQKKLNYSAIVEFVCEAMVASHAEAKETKEAIRKLPTQWASRGSFRRGSAAERILKLIILNPIFTIRQIQELLKVTKPAANQAVNQIVAAKIVRERTGERRNRVFAAEEVLELLARNFAEPPALSLSRAGELMERNPA